MAKPVVKLSFNLPPEDVTTLRELASRRTTTMTGVILKGLSLLTYLQDAADKGGKILIEDRRGRLRQIVL